MYVAPKFAQILQSSTRDFDVLFPGTVRRFLSGCLRSTNTLNDDDAARSTLKRHVAGQNVTTTCTGSRIVPRTYRTDVSTIRKEPPEPRGIPLIGTMLSIAMAGGPQRLHEYVDKRHRELGPIYREQIGPIRGVFINSPNEFRRIFFLEGTTPRHFLPEAWILYNNIRQQRRGLLFMDGDEWLHYRRILNKVMLLSNPSKLMCIACQDVAENLTRKLMIQSRRGAAIENPERQFYQWSIEVMLATLLGSRWQDSKRRMIAECEYLALMLHQILEKSAILSMISAKLAMKLRLPVWTKFVAAADAVLNTVRNLVPEIIRLDGDGLLQMMMNNGIENDDAVRIVGDFIIAAGDTTAFATQWALLLLSGRPKLQDELFDEIKNLSPEEILRHHLLKGVVKEALRLYPVAPFITRYLMTDNLIGDYFVSKEELLILSIYSSSRDAKNFPHANKFLPERWLRTHEGSYQAVTNPYASLPFAMGARSCIGRKLAETQMSLTLAQIIKNFKIECENRDSIKMILHLISVPSKPIKLKLIARKE